MKHYKFVNNSLKTCLSFNFDVDIEQDSI